MSAVQAKTKRVPFRITYLKLKFTLNSRHDTVVFSIQGDQEFALQERFLNTLKEQLSAYGISLVDVVDVWAGSGKAGILALNQVKPNSEERNEILLSQVIKPLVLLNRDIAYVSDGNNQNEEIENITSCLMHAPSVDATEIGVDKVQEFYIENAPLIIALGIGENSKDIHDILVDSVKEDGFVYKRINCFQFRKETEQAYNEKLARQAMEIATLLKNNHELHLLHS